MAASIDSVVAPLPACSLETIPLPIQLRDGRRIWPLMLSCYQLQEHQANRRCGQMDFFAISCPNDGTGAAAALRFDPKPQTVLTTGESSGILDGKWALDASSKSLFSHDDKNYGCNGHNYYLFASAHSSGEVRVHSLRTETNPDKDTGDDISSSARPYKIDHAGQSDVPSRDDSPFCLSLNWSSGRRPQQNGNSQQEQLIVSTYSDGRVAIHSVTTKPPSSLSLSSNSLHLPPEIAIEERHCWLAHSLFRNCPAEVWSADFAGSNDQWIVSCADDAKLKVWDVRAAAAATVVTADSSVFSAGTTCASKHPRIQHVIACGSYDESVALFDIRMMFSRPLAHLKETGGGIWRLKWHPLRDNVLLVAAMHGGCRVLHTTTTPGDNHDDWSLHVDRQFTLHKSMAYGADWLVDRDDKGNLMEAAASCSFYDQAVHIWSTQ